MIGRFRDAGNFLIAFGKIIKDFSILIFEILYFQSSFLAFVFKILKFIGIRKVFGLGFESQNCFFVSFEGTGGFQISAFADSGWREVLHHVDLALSCLRAQSDSSARVADILISQMFKRIRFDFLFDIIAIYISRVFIRQMN